MRVVRYLHEQRKKYGVEVDGIVHEVLGPVYEGLAPGTALGMLDDLSLLAPCEPSKVVCVGRNYASHIAEMGRPNPTHPFIFLKASNAVVGPDAPVLRPPQVERLDYEGELGVVVGRALSRSSPGVEGSFDNWRDYVFGYTCGNDMTIRDWQGAGDQWARAKSSDTLCPLGPWVETDVADPGNVRIQTYVNGERRQDGSTSDFIFDIPTLLSFVARSMTLLPGDVVLTGTPGGVGPVHDGDVVQVEIEGIGRLRNYIKST